MATRTENDTFTQLSDESSQPAGLITRPLQADLRGGKAATVVLALAIFLATFFLASFRSGDAIDINQDEATYVIESVALERTGMTLWNGQPFFVHPPLFFLIEGGYFKALGIGNSPLFTRLLDKPIIVGQPLLPADAPLSSDNVFNAIMAGRYLSVLYASMIAVLVFLLGTAFFNRWAGLLASLLFMLDPYVIRRDHFNMLEPLATLCGVLLVGAYYITLQKQDWVNRRPWLISIGVFFGLALLSKELAVIYAIPLGLHALIFRRERLRELLLALVTGIVIYSVFPLWAALSGHFDIWFQTKIWLFSRISGKLQDTGIARPGTSVASSVNTSLYDYWPSFVLMGAGGLLASAFIYLYFVKRLRDTPAELLTSLIVGCYAFFGVVAVIGGVLNEQFFYVMMPFITLTVGYAVVAGPDLMARLRARSGATISGAVVQAKRRPSGRQLIRGLLVVAVATLLVFTAYAWVERYVISSDDSYARVEGRLAATTPPGSAVVGRDPLDFYLLPKDTVYAVSFLSDFGNPVVPMDIAAKKIPYALLNDQALYQRYNGANVPYYDWIRRNGNLTYTFDGRLWNTYIYQLDYNKPLKWDTIGADSISVGKPAVASSTEDPTKYPASYAFDSIASSRWSSAASDPQWIYVDLGRSTTISRVTLAWEEAYARSYQVQVSDDAKTWTTVYSTDSGKGGYEVDYISARGRYVRLYLTTRGTEYGYSLWEMSVYP